MSAKLRLFSLVAGAVALAIIAVLVWRHQAAERTAALDAGQRAAMEQVVRDTLMKHPEIILDAVQALEKQRKAADADAQDAVLAAHRKALDDDPNSAVLGNPQGDVTVVEFFDYHCPYCKAMTDGVFDIINSDGKVRYVMKELPVLGPESVYAARAAIAARNQQKYEELHRALMHIKGPLNEQTVMRAAAEVGINTDKLKKDMEDEQIDKIINDDLALAHTLDIEGTPGWVIGKQATSGAMSPQAFKQLIEQARRTKS